MREMCAARKIVAPLWRESRPIRRFRRRACGTGRANRRTEANHHQRPSPRSLRGLDWFVFFVADVQTGFGPFVSVFLTTQKWTQVDIGLVLSAAGFVSLIGQMPGGALVDAARSERFVAGDRHCGHLPERSGLRGASGLSDGSFGGDFALARKLRTRPGDCRHQPRSGRPRRDRRTARTQRPLRFDW